MPFDPVPEALREQAGQVVEHLCALRGGALLLSGTDAKLLVDWLEGGVSPALIALALERVAERRRKRRVRGRLSLRACKGELERLRAGRHPPATQPPPQAGPAGDPEALEAEALAALAALPPSDPAGRAEAAMAIVRRFHLEAWRAAEAEHPALRARAAEELAGLRDALDPGAWDEAIEEVARDLLRQRHPRLSASAVWDSLLAP